MSTFVQYDGADGDLGKFSVPFPYLLQQHVKVKVNGFPQTQGVHYQFDDPSSIRFMPWAVPLPNTVVEIRRDTSSDTPLVNYLNGAVLTAEDLNVGTRQNFYLIQEVVDRIDALLGDAASRLSNGQFTNAQNLIDAAVASVLDSALLAELQSRISDIDTNAQSIIDQDIRLNSMWEIVDRISDIDTIVVNETNARIEGDQALVDTLALIGAKSGDNLAFIADLDTLKVSPTESFAQRFSALTAADANAAALITAEQTARTDADSALASDIANLVATVNDNGAAILAEQTARASADSALASSITTLQTTVNGHTASIQTQATAIDGLNAQYTIKTQTVGPSGKPVIAGIGLASSSSGSEVYIMANRFAVVDPASPTSVKVPFVISGGVCYMQNVVIADALIESLTVGKLTAGSLNAPITQNADINVGTGRIIWSNGAFMRVVGVGFGVNHDLIDWFGPSMSVNSCSKGNARYYLSTDGSGYFGGSLSAGVLHNAIQTSSLAANAEVTLGPYGTNGNPKQVIVSYHCGRSRSGVDNPATDTFAGSVTVQLYRTIAGGAANVLVRTDTFTGGGTKAFIGPGEGWTYTWNVDGSYTITDNLSPTTGDRTYRAVITGRSLYENPSAQRLSIVSTE